MAMDTWFISKYLEQKDTFLMNIAGIFHDAKHHIEHNLHH